MAHADGDARRLLNAYENVANLAARDGAITQIDETLLEQALGEQLRRYDKSGDQFYDTISALHKSVRGSDPDATLYWLARMLDGGVDPRYVARRLLRMASEDIGLADPRALHLAVDAAEVFERLGSPEGELALAQAAVYLAMAPKSNAVYSAWNAVRALVRSDGTRPVPEHLRNAPTRLMKQLGHGAGLPLCARRGRRLRGRRDLPARRPAAHALLRAGAARPGTAHRRAPGRTARAERQRPSRADAPAAR